eukprot:6141194-Pyramimonas_sp.AAC.1
MVRRRSRPGCGRCHRRRAVVERQDRAGLSSGGRSGWGGSVMVPLLRRKLADLERLGAALQPPVRPL